jgi:hypothetical protein
MVTTHEPVPLQAPDQPAKIEPEAAVAVSVTCVPGKKSLVQVDPQSIAAGLDVTLPEPVPALPTVSVFGLGGAAMRAKTAVAERFWSIVSVQPPVPEQSPVQPANVEPGAAVAASLTTVPNAKSRVQLEKQSLKPPG